jgi:hypothetical protein
MLTEYFVSAAISAAARPAVYEYENEKHDDQRYLY